MRKEGEKHNEKKPGVVLQGDSTFQGIQAVIYFVVHIAVLLVNYEACFWASLQRIH